MAKKTFKTKDIINKSREAVVPASQGKTVGEICKALWISDQIYYRRWEVYGMMGTEKAKRLNELEQEHARQHRWRIKYWTTPSSRKLCGENTPSKAARSG